MSDPSALDAPPNAAIRRRLLRWFAGHKRDLPWRAEPRDPYHVWLAEVMLQQTQVATVIPYYRRWLERFPTLKDLAGAPLDDVLKLWEGLGYYSRARNLHRAAQVVLREHGGNIPDTIDGLLELPGIGRYTAGAIASLAFKRAAPILDGNVARVLSRVFALAGDVKSAPMVKELWQLSESLLPADRAGEFNEALMDLGATVCTPRMPACPACPLRTVCSAYAKGRPEAYPVKAAKRMTPHKDIGTAVIIAPDGRVLMAQRPAQGLLGGLWEFPGGEVTFSTALTPRQSGPALKGREGARGLARQLQTIIRANTGLRIHIGDADFIGQVKHAFTHFQMTRHVAVVRLEAGDCRLEIGAGYHALRWVLPDEIQQIALTRSDQKIVALALGNNDRNPRLL